MRLDILIPEAAPLRCLAQREALQALFRLGKVHVPDLAVIEAIRSRDPEASLISQWVSFGTKTGQLVISETSIGEALRLARVSTPDYDAAEVSTRACHDWMISKCEAMPDIILIAYESEWVAKCVLHHNQNLSSALIKSSELANIVLEDVLLDAVARK